MKNYLSEVASIEIVIRVAVEMQRSGVGDWCGEQREFHLPRINRIVSELTVAFPVIFADVLIEIETEK